MQRRGGMWPIYWDAKEGKIYLELDNLGQDFLFLTALNSGLGSNPVGLDRGQLGDSIICRWRRIGPRIYLEQQNTKFRADDGSDAERRAVRESFASSILWSGEVAAEGQSHTLLVDVTSLVVSDRHGIRAALRRADQGDFSLDRDRSFPMPELLEAFPDNVELHAQLTFTNERPGREASAVAATGESLTIGQRISLVQLPEPGYRPRQFDPRVGSFAVSYADYAAPLERSIFRRLMTRHRLELDEQGKVIKPIVYYVDAAAPEPIRGALLEGASWWSEAFEQAGFPGGFRVEVAPPEMDPLDLRFNFIQWVHRQTRGWSYGSSVIDPRTGEILKGHVSLGSLRVRQDRLLIENVAHATADNVAAVNAATTCGMQIPHSHATISEWGSPETARLTPATPMAWGWEVGISLQCVVYMVTWATQPKKPKTYMF